MGYSGLIYAAIVAAWAAVLVPRWVRRNEEVERARESDAARGVRVLQRRHGPIHATHPRSLDLAGTGAERTVLHGGTRGLTVGAPPAGEATGPGGERLFTASSDPSSAALAEVRAAFAQAARRRRRVLLSLIVALVGVSAATALVPLELWAPAVPGGALLLFLLLARRSAVVQARRRARLLRAVARHRVRATAEDAEPARPEVELTADGKRVAVYEPPEAPVVDPDAWEPVPVPQPTYLSKPMAPRPTRTIDLTLPGSWTSGRLDPASSLELPPQQTVSASAGDASTAEAGPADEEGALPEHRRAVGD